jgi:hypothetical protein
VGSMVSGAQKSAAENAAPWNPGGATPITVRFVRFSVIDLPIMDGSLAKTLRHALSLSTTTGEEPGAVHSLAAKARPIDGCTPRAEK